MRRFLNANAYPPRLFAFASATIVAGALVTAGAAYAAVSSNPSLRDLAGVAVFFGLALFAEFRPVPVDADGGRLVSLALVFVIAAEVLFGWEWSVLVGATAIAIAQLPLRVDAVRLLFNSAVYALAAAVAAAPTLLGDLHLGGASYAAVAGVVFASGAVFALTNVVLVCLAMAFAADGSVRRMVMDHLRHSGPAFSIMAFIAAQAVIFWNISPMLLILVSAPLFTLNMYQRSAVRGRIAAEAASKDSLTGLKNHRAYELDVVAALAAAEANGTTLALCLIDVDRFKQVNDRYGHSAGDAVLSRLGGLLEDLAPGTGYRLGGDELGVLVPGPTSGAEALIQRLQARLAATEVPGTVDAVTVSGGIASFPDDATDADELKKRADLALYQSKHNGKNRYTVYSGDHVALGPPRAGNQLASLDARLRTAERLVAVVDARDAYVGEHSAGVAQLVDALARILELNEEREQLRIAGLLHDLGKIAIADSILNKPGPLSATEQELMRRHPQVGFELLSGLELAPIDTWILHHHEHWDGSGYPFGLAGAEIPFGSRIILVADAFEAMTTTRSYRRAISVEAAVSEIREKAGTQFDPLVVAALETHLAALSETETPAETAEVMAWSS